jgi:hypothetical protein
MAFFWSENACQSLDGIGVEPPAGMDMIVEATVVQQANNQIVEAGPWGGRTIRVFVTEVIVRRYAA